VSEVYERSVEAFPYSVDLWTYYCTYLAERLADPTLVRRFACFPLRQNLARFLFSIHACTRFHFQNFLHFVVLLIGLLVPKSIDVCELT
jgi:hypothetical protein